MECATQTRLHIEDYKGGRAVTEPERHGVRATSTVGLPVGERLIEEIGTLVIAEDPVLKKLDREKEKVQSNQCDQRMFERKQIIGPLPNGALFCSIDWPAAVGTENRAYAARKARV